MQTAENEECGIKWGVWEKIVDQSRLKIQSAVENSN